VIEAEVVPELVYENRVELLRRDFMVVGVVDAV
jgi:hypothetical protein